MPSEKERVKAFFAKHPEWSAFLSERAKEGRMMNVEDVSKDDVLVIVASSDPAQIVGAKQAQCGCGRLVWLSPSTQKVLIERGRYPTRISCISCVTENVVNAQEG
jgi:hypothetical protein